MEIASPAFYFQVLQYSHLKVQFFSKLTVKFNRELRGHEIDAAPAIDWQLSPRRCPN